MALSTEISTQLRQYLVKLKSDVVIEAFVDESEVSTNMSELLVELAEMTEKISLNIYKDYKFNFLREDSFDLISFIGVSC